MLNDPNKAGSISNGLVSALYVATAVLLGLLLYFTVRSGQSETSDDVEAALIKTVSPQKVLGPGDLPHPLPLDEIDLLNVQDGLMA